MGIFV
jgi:hypothetical protein